MDILQGSIREVQADSAADALQDDTVVTDDIVISSLKTAQFDLNGLSDLQNNSPFSFLKFKLCLLLGSGTNDFQYRTILK